MEKSIEDYIKEQLRYDADTGLFWWNYAKVHRNLDKPVGSNHNQGYKLVCIRFNGKKNYYLLHRLAWFMFYGVWPEDQIDHTNGIRSDNRIVNLREVSNGQNQQNSISKKGSSSQYKGICWYKPYEKWMVRLPNKFLGYFNCEIEAAKVYDKHATEMFGKYARLNNV